jgi:integrase
LKNTEELQPKLKTLPKRHATKTEGIFYKEIIDLNKKNKVVDKVYIIRYRENDKDKLFTIGKEKEDGITITYVKNKRIEFINKINLGEDPLSHKKKKNIITLNQLAKVYFDDKRCLKCANCKAFKKLDDTKQLEVKLTDKDLNCDLRAKKHLLNKYNKHLEPTFSKKDISDIKKDDVNKFVQKLQGNNKAHNTINGIIQLMSAIINYSIKNKELNIINPCTGVPKLTTDNDRQRYLSTEEVKQLLDYLKDDKRTLLFVKLALSTGGRLQTILNIQKKDLDLKDNSITLKDFKNNDTYKGFIDDDLKTELQALTKPLNPNDYVIGAKATRLSTNALSTILRPILNKLFNNGLDKNDSKNRVVIHTLRHTFASHLVINGTPIFTVKSLMNHRDINMTMRYAKLAPDSGKDVVRGLYK